MFNCDVCVVCVTAWWMDKRSVNSRHDENSAPYAYEAIRRLADGDSWVAYHASEGDTGVVSHGTANEGSAVGEGEFVGLLSYVVQIYFCQGTWCVLCVLWVCYVFGMCLFCVVCCFKYAVAVCMCLCVLFYFLCHYISSHIINHTQTHTESISSRRTWPTFPKSLSPSMDQTI